MLLIRETMHCKPGKVRPMIEMFLRNLQAFETMMKGEGITAGMGKEFEKISAGYHDLVESGRRDVFKIEG